MTKKFNSIIYSMIGLSIVSIIIGIIMLCWPAKALYTFALLIGVYFIIHGIAQIIVGIRASKYHLPYDGTAYGVLSLIFGIICIIVFTAQPAITEMVLSVMYGVAIGISIIIAGVYDIKASSMLKRVPNSNWGLILVFGIISVILGIFLMFSPLATGLAVTMWSGIILIVFGIIQLIDSICLKSQASQYENAVKRKADDISDLINKGVNTASDMYKEGRDIVEDQIDKFNK